LADTAFEGLAQRSRVLVLAHQRHDVVGAEKQLRVGQRDEPVGEDRRVGGEDVRRLRLTVEQRVDDRLALERAEVLGHEAVDIS
jgi:hypothetical protein